MCDLAACKAKCGKIFEANLITAHANFPPTQLRATLAAFPSIWNMCLAAGLPSTPTAHVAPSQSSSSTTLLRPFTSYSSLLDRHLRLTLARAPPASTATADVTFSMLWCNLFTAVHQFHSYFLQSIPLSSSPPHGGKRTGRRNVERKEGVERKKVRGGYLASWGWDFNTRRQQYG